MSGIFKKNLRLWLQRYMRTYQQGNTSRKLSNTRDLRPEQILNPLVSIIYKDD